MITLSPDDVKKRFGPLFAEKFLAMGDERAGAAGIHEGTVRTSGGKDTFSKETGIPTPEEADGGAEMPGGLYGEHL